MLLCVNVGNTNTVGGLYKDGEWVARWRVRTVHDRMPDEYAMLWKALLNDRGYSFRDVRRVTISSVVPPVTGALVELCENYFGFAPLLIGPGIKTGMRIRIDNPAELGADLLCDAVAAYHRFRTACIAIDFGTATTLSAVSENGDFMGVSIALGLGPAADALAGRTAQLPRINLVPPPAAIGKNTVHSMQSGLIFGYVGLVEGLVARMRYELGGQAKVVATGGLVQVLAPLLKCVDVVDPWLTLDGVRLLSERNAPPEGRTGDG